MSIMGIILINKAKCLQCGDILISKDAAKMEVCSCGSLEIGGGSHFVARKGNKFREMSQFNDLTNINPNENVPMSPPKQ